MKLANKKAIVTGANRSIGRAIAIAFAQEGADVVISYRSDKEGAKNTIEIIQTLRRNGKAIYSDFSQITEIDSFFEASLAFLGHVDILVNNAAGYDTSSFLELEVNTLELLFKVGVLGVMHLSQLVAKHMIQHSIQGSIINISSISGLRPYKNRTAHSTVKAALNMLTQNMALELGPYAIRVNAIAPGNTPYEIMNEEIQIAIPLQRVGIPEDHANTALFLASEETSWMTGQIITIDGGQSLSL